MIAEKVAFLQDEFMGFVEPAWAVYIIACAMNAEHEIELGEDFLTLFTQAVRLR